MGPPAGFFVYTLPRVRAARVYTALGIRIAWMCWRLVAPAVPRSYLPLVLCCLLHLPHAGSASTLREVVEEAKKPVAAQQAVGRDSGDPDDGATDAGDGAPEAGEPVDWASKAIDAVSSVWSAIARDTVLATLDGGGLEGGAYVSTRIRFDAGITGRDGFSSSTPPNGSSTPNHPSEAPAGPQVLGALHASSRHPRTSGYSPSRTTRSPSSGRTTPEGIAKSP
jgi:hypothetical protein